MEHNLDHTLFPRKLRMELLEALCVEQQSYIPSLSEVRSQDRTTTQLKNYVHHLKAELKDKYLSEEYHVPGALGQAVNSKQVFVAQPRNS